MLENATGDIGLLRDSHKRSIAIGELPLGSEFVMEFIDAPSELKVKIRTTQIPEIKRQIVEDTGHMGLAHRQFGPVINSGEISVTLVDDLDGKTMSFVRDLVVNKKAIDIEIRIAPESKGGQSTNAQRFKLSGCLVGSDAIDLSTEDNTVAYKPTLTIVYQWVEMEEGR